MLAYGNCPQLIFISHVRWFSPVMELNAPLATYKRGRTTRNLRSYRSGEYLFVLGGYEGYARDSPRDKSRLLISCSCILNTPYAQTSLNSLVRETRVRGRYAEGTESLLVSCTQICLMIPDYQKYNPPATNLSHLSTLRTSYVRTVQQNKVFKVRMEPGNIQKDAKTCCPQSCTYSAHRHVMPDAVCISKAAQD